MKRRTALMSAMLLVAGVLVFRYQSSPEPHPEIVRSAAQTPVEPGVETAPDHHEATVTADTPDCLSLEELEPAMIRDSYRFEQASAGGSTISAYRGLAMDELHDFANQGDSAAMTVLGAMALVQARGLAADNAVAYLLAEPGLQPGDVDLPPDAATAALLEESRNWFFRAALHGRVLALYHVGDVLWTQGIGPVELGWISREEHDQLQPTARNVLMPQNVYGKLAFEIAPGLKTGPLGDAMYNLLPETERQQQIVALLKQQFEEALEAAGLPPVSITASTLPATAVLRRSICDSALEQLEGDRQ